MEKRGWVNPEDTPPLVEELPKQGEAVDAIETLDDEDARKRLINQCDTLTKPEITEDTNEFRLDMPEVRTCVRSSRE